MWINENDLKALKVFKEYNFEIIKKRFKKRL